MKKVGLTVVIVFIFLTPLAFGPASEGDTVVSKRAASNEDDFILSDWQDGNEGTGAARPVDFQGRSLSSGTSVIDSTHSAYIGIDPPLGWSSDQLEAQLDHLSMWVDDVLVNQKLDAYHEEHWLLTDRPDYNSDPFFIPDAWTFVKNDAIPSGTQHPQHGYFEINRVAGAGYDASSGWRFDGNLDSGATVNPTNGFYMSQQIPMPWRSVYSAEITFRYYVSSTSTLNDELFISTSLEGYVSKYHVFEPGTPMDTWLQASATVPSSYFESSPATNALLFNIGLGTDINGNPSTADHEVYIDEPELRLLVRPFPEQIDLLANGARVTGSTEGSVSPYVPKGYNRDCYSALDSNGGSGGVDLNGYSDDGVLDVGIDGADWSSAFAYQVGLQFPLYVPQGSAITSTILEIGSPSGSVGNPAMRIYVADEDDVAAFTSGYPLLPDRYDWVNTSIFWNPTISGPGRYQTPDLSALIEEVVSRPGWQVGNYICIMIDYAYSSGLYYYNQFKGSAGGFQQGELAQLFVDFTAPAFSDVIPSFRYNKNIVIDHTKVVSDLQDFPVLVDIWDADLHLDVQPDGDDIAFLFNGQVIPHEIDVFDKQGNGTHAHLSAWVKVPYLSSVQDTTIVMVYGDDDLGNQENSEDIWDSDYSAVWHLNENPAQPQWSSTYADNLPHYPQIIDVAVPSSSGTSYGSMTSTDLVDGFIGSGIDFDGTDDYLDFGNPSELQMSSAFTVEAWFYADYVDNDYLVVKSGESNYRGWDLSFDNDPSISPAGWVMFRWSPDGVNMDLVGYERIDTGQWYQVVGVFCPSTFARFYLNGELVGEVTSGLPTSVNNPNRPVRIGRRSDTAGATSYFDGIVDEVRISNIARSDGWIRTQYLNQRNPELFLTVGEEGTNFRYMKDIMIDHNQVASDLGGFPVLIDIFDTDLHTDVQADGGDIMFISNGRSLPHEIELFDQQYNSTHAHLIAWVKADLSSTYDTVLTMYYGNPTSGNQENPNDVWRSDYAGVWHLSESIGNADDSSQFDLSGSISGGVTQSQPGVVGTCYVFDGSNGNVNFGNPADGHLDFGENEFTYSAWVRIDQSTGNYQLPIFKGGTMTSDTGYEMETNTAGTDIKAELSDGTTVIPSDVTSVTFGQWMYLVAVVDPTSGYLRFYMNGTIVGSPTSISSLGDLSNSQTLQLSQSTYPIDGAIDEFRLISEARTVEWILTEYNNQKDPSGFYSIGIEREVITPEEVPIEFMYKKDFTIDHNKVESDLTGFPVLIDIYDVDLRTNVQADGDDIVFVKDGWILPHEIELFDQSHNSSHAHLVAWVRMDLSSTSDTVFSMYYGDPYSSNCENPEGVWDTAFAAVWHLSEDPAGTVYDSTANGNDGVGLSVSSEPTLQAGKIDGCSEFYGETTKDRIEAPHSSSLTLPSDILVEAWIRTNNTDPTSDAIVAKWGDVGHRNYWLGKLNSSTLAFYVDNTQSVTASFSLVNDGSWHHIVGVANADTGRLLLYIDGIERGNVLYSGSTQTGTSAIQIANNPGSVGFIQEWDGRIDEVRISASYRSSGWIITEFNNQNDPDSFYVISGETSTTGVYDYSRQITVDAGPESVPAGYSISITIDHAALVLAEKSQADGDDIRIVYWNGLNMIELDRVLDSDSSWNSATTKIWFKIQSVIPASTSDENYYLYYGDPSVSTPLENPTKVFQFYDGFESGDLSAWDGSYTDTGDSLSVTTEQANTGVYSAKGDVDTQAAAQAMVWKDLSDLTNILARVHFYLPATFSTTDHVTIMQFVDTSSGWVNQLSLTIRDDMTFYLWNAIAGEAYGYGTTSSISTGSWHMLELQAKFSATTGEARMWFDGNLEVEETGKNLGAEGIDRFCTVFYWASPQTESNIVYADDAFLRLYVNPEPTTSLGAETVNQPVEFTYKKDIVIDHTKVDADLTDFPLLIDIYDTDLRTDVQADGDDIIFKTGETSLPHEIELFDKTYNLTHAHLVAWVKTNLSSSTDTTITMYYGNSQLENQEKPTVVWDDYYGAVWHLNGAPIDGTPGSVKDSTTNNNDGTPQNFDDGGGGSTNVVGQIDGAFNFGGDDDHVTVPNPSNTDQVSQVTISAWIKVDDPVGGEVASRGDCYGLRVWNDGRVLFYKHTSVTWINMAPSGVDVIGNGYHYLVGVQRPTGMFLYLDGQQIDSNGDTDSIVYNLGNTVEIGTHGNGDTGYEFLGIIDEVRISITDRSAAWISTEYNNQNDPATFYTIGTEEYVVSQQQEFDYKKDIVIDHNKVNADLTDFPLLIDIYDTDLRTDVQADGDDIIFKSGETMLPHEFELFDQTYNLTHAHLVAWVKTNLSSSADTTITMYYGNPQATSQEDPISVWNDDYMGVWHLSEASGNAEDSTNYQTHGTPSGLVTQGVSGHIGNAYYFDRDGVGTVNMGDPADGHLDFGNTDDFTIEFWVDLDYFYYYEPFMVSKRNGLASSSPGYAAFVSDDSNGYAGYSISSDGPQFGVDATTPLLDTGWRHVVYVFDQDSDTISTIFVDGVDDKSSTWGTIGSVGSLQNSANFRLNGESSPSTDDMFDGMLDEVRISRVARSADWVLTEFRNQDNPSSFYSVGIEKTLGAAATFNYRKDITIDHTKVASDLTDFPLLIDIFDTDLRTDVQADGDDIIFKLGTTILPHEIELFNQTYNSTHAHLIAWVKTDLSSSADTTISMYYGSPQATNQEDPSGVWIGDYKGVWHLSETPTETIHDSTSNSNHGTGYNLQSDDQVDGQIDGSIDFDDTQDYINCGNDTSLNVGSNDFSLSLWFKYDGVSMGVLAGKGAVLMAKRYRLSIESGPGMLMANIDDDNIVKSISSTLTYGDNLWHHVSMVRDGNYLRLYIDGVEDPNSPIDITGYGSLDESESFYINAFRSEVGGTLGYWSSANIDEVRIANMALSPDWIATEYSNQLDPDGFYSIGEETTRISEYQPGAQTADFKYRKNLVVDHTKVSEDLTDFAMLIDIFDADLRTDVQPDGDDIMFKSGNAWCPHEITFFDQTYNSTHAHLIAWIKTDLSSSVDTIITMYYGNPDLSALECPAAVWSNYVGVWHLDDSPTEAVYDSSQYNNDGDTLGSMSGSNLVSGQIGNGFELDGIDDMINVSESSSLDSIKYAGTLSLWIYWANASDGGYQRVMTTSDRFILNPSPPPTLFQDDGFEWTVQGDGDLFFYPWGGDSIDYNLATNPFTNNIWHHLVVTLDYSSKSVIIYLDGAPLVLAIENVPTQWTQLASLGDWLWGGNQLDADSHFEGIFDEIRASNVVRPLDWILTEYNNQYDPSSFYSIGSEEKIPSRGYEFSTSSDSSVTIGVSLSLGVQTSAFTYSNESSIGTSFSIVNSSVPTWTANVLVSPPPELDAVSFEVSYPEGEWYPFSVKSPTGVEKSFASDWTCFDGKLVVGASAIDEYGMWQIQFQDRNHVFDTQMGPMGGPYSSSNEFLIGEDIEFQVWSSGTVGSTIYLELTDPSGSTWYSGSTTFQGQRFSLPYHHRKQLTISHDSIAAELVDFPVLIDIYDTDLRTDVRADGRDIAFAIGEETLTHEIELFDQTYNGTHAHLVAWIKVPVLSDSSDTVISMYYGNSIAPIVYDSGPVWDSGYLGVWHLDESGTGAPDEYRDSSLYQNHGQGGEGNSSFVPTQTSGKIGFGQDFNNLDGYYDLIDCGDSPLWNIDGYQITLEAWIQHDITPNTHVYGIMNHKGWYDGYALYVNYGGGLTLKPTFSLPGETHQLVGANDVTGGAWHHIVATYDGSLMRIYVDGVQDPNVLAKTDAILPSSYEQGFWIGHGDQPKDKVWSAEWDGQIDEVRISDVVRSAGWIQTEFNNQYDPAAFYSAGAEESAGYSESTAITLDSSASAGIWHASARYSDSSLEVNNRVGLFSRSFSVKRGATLSLAAPGDAVSDGITAKLIGEGLYVEYELSDTLTSEPISGATLTMNWSVSGTPTEVQLNDYGDGSYGKVLNTTDLGTAQRWRLELTSDHQFYGEATSVLFLDLSGQTYLTYEPPSPTVYGDDFAIKVTVRDSFSKLPIANADFTSNGTLVGLPVDYGNGTYLLTIDSSVLSIGEHAFRFTATPTDSYLMSSSIDVQFDYRSVYTEAYAVSSDSAEIPWGEEANITIQWNDLDHSGIGIVGGTPNILPLVPIQPVEGGSGIYTLSIDLTSYSPGTYVFDVSLSKTNYQDGTVSITIIVIVHRTSVSIDYSPETLVGTSTSFDISFLDIDGGSTSIGSGNLSQIDVDWGTGSQSFASYSFVLDTSSWSVGFYSINFTIYSTTGPRFYSDATISINLEIRKLHVYINWDHLETFPNGNDFEIFVHLNVSEPSSSLDGNPINGLAQSYFTARNETGSLYNLKIFTFLGDGQYRLVIDQNTFQEGEYTIVIYVDFLSAEDYIDSHTPVITFTYRPILTYLSSDDYPTVTTTYDTNVTILLNYVDTDNIVNITTGVITAEGASIIWQHLGDGLYEVLVIVNGWDLGSHEVNITADAVSYQAKTLSFEVLVQIAYAYARSSTTSIDLPVGDIAVFYVDYWDIIHDEPILGANIDHNWAHGLTVIWTGTQYRVELPSYDTDILGTYLIMFNVSKEANYQFGYFNVSLTLRTHYTEFRLAAAVEPTTYNGMVNVSLYYGDLDNDDGILSQYINASVYGDSGWIASLLENDTIRGDGFYILRFSATSLGEEGIFNFTVYFNWTGAVLQFYNGMIRTSVNIIGEESRLSLEDSPGPTPYLENMTYAYFYGELYSGNGVSNSSGNVFIFVEFNELTIDSSLISIREGTSGHYTIEFNTTIFAIPDVYTMIVYVNWSESVAPFYDNRTDTISVRVIPRNTVVAVIPPDSTPYGVNATFSFSFDDMTDAVPISIPNDSKMHVVVNLPDYSITYNITTKRFHVSFNTSVLGASLGSKQFTISVTWDGAPFYANITARTVLVSVTARETSFDFATPTPTSYGEIVSFTVSYTDITEEITSPIEDGIIALFNSSTPIPGSFYNYIYMGNGEYLIELNTTFYSGPGSYTLVVEISTGHFYYLDQIGSRAFNIKYRLTTLAAEPVGIISYNSSILLVMHYRDLLSLLEISNVSYLTSIEIMNGSSWLFTSEWRSASMDYLVTVQTYNQVLDIDRNYLLWIKFSYSDSAPFYLPADAYVSFRLRERATVLDLIEAPTPAPYLDSVNFTVSYLDLELASEIGGAEILLSIDGSGLVEGSDYTLQTTGDGTYYISVSTTSIGAPGTLSNLLVRAQWSSGSPYYSDASILLTIGVVERSASVSIITSPSLVRFMDNVTFTFIYSDDTTDELITLTKDMVSIYSGGVLLQNTDFMMQYVVDSYEISINSAILSSSLVTNWNVTVYVDWSSTTVPYYTDDGASVGVTVTNRVGIVNLGTAPATPIGDNMSLTFSYKDERSNQGIGIALVEFDCLSPSGLVENVNFWVIRGTGVDTGQYTILVDTADLNGIGQYTFSLRLLWNPSIAPYYRNTSELFLSGSIRLIQSLLTNDEPSPSTIPINDNVSVILTFTDLDHDVPIEGALPNISIIYKSDSSTPSIWNLAVVSPGVYELVVNCTDISLIGTDALVIRVNMSMYQFAEVQIPIQIRARQGDLSKLPPPEAYFGEETYAIVELVDLDASSTPIPDAILTISWPDISSYVHIGNGRYNITLGTSTLDAGLYTLVVGAQKLNYFIPDISISIRILSIPTEIILPQKIADVYWGETVSVWALFNDTRSGSLISGADVVFEFGILQGSLSEGVPTGNYSFSVNTGSLLIATTYVISITASLNNYITATGQVTVNILRLGLELTIVDGLQDQTLYKGQAVNITVFVRDTYNDAPLMGATVIADWSLIGQSLILTQVPGKDGYYTGLLDSQDTIVKMYVIVIRASRTNYVSMSTSASVAIEQIPTVVWLDSMTATYSSTSFNWSDTIRIGVYVLSPYLNESNPYSTGLSNSTVTWSLSGTYISGEFLNGTMLGGAGYFYFDFQTWEYNATTYTFRIIAAPYVQIFAQSNNMTTLTINPVETTVDSSYVSSKVWGWADWVNLTYWDLLDDRAVVAASVGIDWNGQEELSRYLSDDGVYQVWINTSLVSPGVYPVVVNFWKQNYEAGTGVFTLTVKEVPTDIVVYAPQENLAESRLDLIVPYGDLLSLTLFYNDTWYNQGIVGATNLVAIIMGEPIADKDDLTIIEVSNGNYSLIIDSGLWTVSPIPYSIFLSVALENRSKSTLTLQLTIIDIPTALDIDSESIVLSYSQTVTVWVFYHSTWESHNNRGISGGDINATSLDTVFVVVSDWHPDDSRTGWYEITLRSQRTRGSAVVSIQLSKENHESASLTLAVSVEPSDMDLLIERSIIFGFPIGIICLVGAYLWSRIFSLPKLLRKIGRMVKDVGRGRIPKVPDEVRTRQELVAELFNDNAAAIGVVKTAEVMPKFPVTLDVPEIEELLIQLSILSELTPEELEDFRNDVSKMKLSEQVAFTKEVINQEAIKQARIERKSMEMVLAETAEQARAQIAGKELPPKPKAPKKVVTEEKLLEDFESAPPEPLEVEDKMPSEFLRESEIEEVRKQLVDAGVKDNELDTIMEQVRELPKELVDELIDSILKKGGDKP
ncbi:MAG: DUF2341 domain-containing protein [Candidatus Thorarchaeota archaeon]